MQKLRKRDTVRALKLIDLIRGHTAYEDNITNPTQEVMNKRLRNALDEKKPEGEVHEALRELELLILGYELKEKKKGEEHLIVIK